MPLPGNKRGMRLADAFLVEADHRAAGRAGEYGVSFGFVIEDERVRHQSLNILLAPLSQAMFTVWPAPGVNGSPLVGVSM